jgi:hypothetical protein
MLCRDACGGRDHVRRLHAETTGAWRHGAFLAMEPFMRRAAIRSGLVLVLGLAFAAGTRAEKAPRTPDRPLRVLFVGNSYIYTHDLPQIVAAVAAARGIDLEPGMLAEPNYAIEDHLAGHDYERALDQGWDWVVLQQGPSSLPENRTNLRVHSGRAASMARARGIRVALMSAWPALENVHTWLDAELSYRLAAQANDLCVLPVATAWRLAREREPSIALYQPDQLHPQREGTLLAALVLADGLLWRPRFATAPELDARLPADWRNATARGATLHRHANAALRAEDSVRCVLEK